MALALAVAVLHAVTVVLLLTGALLALRYRRVVLVHAPVTAAAAAVHVAGADCPLTMWERTLRVRGGQPYDGGFLDHYVFGPLRLDAADPAVQAAVYAVVVVPNLLGYGVLAVRARRRASSRAEGEGTPASRFPPPPAASDSSGRQQRQCASLLPSTAAPKTRALSGHGPTRGG